MLFYGQGELGYTGSKFNISQAGIGETEYKLSGTDASLIIGYKILPLGKLGNLRIFGGYNWKNYSKIKTNNSLNNIDIESNNNSILGGVGVDLWKITVEYRYLAGVSDIDASDRNLKTNASNFSVGFKFL